MKTSEHRVLISSSGTGNAFASVMALKRNYPNVFILTTDVNPANLVTASIYSDKHLVSPSIDNKSYVEFLITMIKQYEIDTFVPFIDTDIKIAASLWKINQFDNNLILQVKDPAIAEICENKFLTYQFLIKNGLPSPVTGTINQPFEADEYVLKPIRGFGSQIRILSKHDLSEVVGLENYIFQEVCEGPEITIDVTSSKKYNFFKAICRERIQTKAGVCTKARIFQDSLLGELSFSIAKLLDLSSFCFQVMKLRGDWVVTDINPRLGAGTALSSVTGNDFFSAMFAIMWALDPSKFHFDLKRDYYVTRQYSEYLMQE